MPLGCTDGPTAVYTFGAGAIGVNGHTFSASGHSRLAPATFFRSQRTKTTATTFTFGPNAVLACPPPHLDRVVVGVVVARKKKLRVVSFKSTTTTPTTTRYKCGGGQGKTSSRRKVVVVVVVFRKFTQNGAHSRLHALMMKFLARVVTGVL